MDLLEQMKKAYCKFVISNNPSYATYILDDLYNYEVQLIAAGLLNPEDMTC